MPKTRISVRVDRALLDEYRQAAGDEADLSAVVSIALENEIHRFEWLAYLDEMQARDPIPEEERVAGAPLWESRESSSTQEPSRRSRKKTGKAGSPSTASC